MADDQKLEVLEEEIKVLKGEVRRTLVDLRALVMRADSPLNDSSLGRRGAMSDLAPNEEAPITRRETSEMIRQEISDPVIASPPPPRPAAPPVPEAVANPAPGSGPGFAAPVPPAGMPPQPAPAWPVTPPVQPPPSPGPAPGAPDSGAAEQILRVADQERRMAEQDRKMAEQERKLAEATRSKPDESHQSSEKQSEQEQRIAKLELNLAEASKPPGPGNLPAKKDDPVGEEKEEKEEKFTESPEEPVTSDQDLGDDEDGTGGDHGEDDIPGPVSGNRGTDRERERRETPKDTEAGVRDPGGEEPDRRPQQETDRRPRQETDRRPRQETDRRPRQEPDRRPHQETGRPPRQETDRGPRQEPLPEDDLPEIKMRSQFDHVEEESEPRESNGRGSPVFDEYFELMDIAEGPELPGPVSASAPVDLNLVASLVRWASIAKYRVGEDRLSGILDLYFQSRPISPSLKELLNQITEMADASPGDEDQTAQVCVDLISHLHGILTGGLPAGQVSQVVLPTKG